MPQDPSLAGCYSEVCSQLTRTNLLFGSLLPLKTFIYHVWEIDCKMLRVGLNMTRNFWSFLFFSRPGRFSCYDLISKLSTSLSLSPPCNPISCFLFNFGPMFCKFPAWLSILFSSPLSVYCLKVCLWDYKFILL